MNDKLGPLTADREFFAALSRGIIEYLDRVIADDFILIEVMGGSEITKSFLLAAIQALLRELGAFNMDLCVITTRMPVADLSDHQGSSAVRRDLEHLSSHAGRIIRRVNSFGYQVP